jgi:DNA polymerase-1
MGLNGAEEMARSYEEGSSDFHQFIADATGLKRTYAKIINLGIIYGLGKPNLAIQLGVPVEEAEELLITHNQGAPFMRELFDKAKSRAAKRGIVKTLLGRRGRFPYWQPYRKKGEEYKPVTPQLRKRAEKLRETKSEKDWYNCHLVRAFIHKGLNKVIQGGSADQMKMAMRNCWREGIVPTLQMHDELCLSGDEQKAKRVEEIMLNAVQLKVSSKVDVAIADNWGEAV